MLRTRIDDRSRRLAECLFGSVISKAIRAAKDLSIVEILADESLERCGGDFLGLLRCGHVVRIAEKNAP